MDPTKIVNFTDHAIRIDRDNRVWIIPQSEYKLHLDLCRLPAEIGGLFVVKELATRLTSVSKLNGHQKPICDNDGFTYIVNYSDLVNIVTSGYKCSNFVAPDPITSSLQGLQNHQVNSIQNFISWQL
jgi:hypothetical protein